MKNVCFEGICANLCSLHMICQDPESLNISNSLVDEVEIYPSELAHVLARKRVGTMVKRLNDVA